MGTLNDRRSEIAGKLTAAGISTTVDPRAVAPFVLVGVPIVLGGVGIGGWSVDYPVHIVATPPGDADAVTWLLDQVEIVLRTLGATTANYGTYGDKRNPAYELTYRYDVANPDC